MLKKGGGNPAATGGCERPDFGVKNYIPTLNNNFEEIMKNPLLFGMMVPE